MLYGCRNVCVILKAGCFFGFDDGVCTAQHLMKTPIKRTKATPISKTAHQYSCIIKIVMMIEDIFIKE